MSRYQKKRLQAKLDRIYSYLHRTRPADWDAIYIVARIRCEVYNEKPWFTWNGKKISY